MTYSLTKDGVIQTLRSNVESAILQVLSVKPMAAPGGAATGSSGGRLRLQLSDGIYNMPALVNNCPQNKDIELLCLIEIQKYSVQRVQGKLLVIILAFNVVSPPIGHRIEPNGVPSIEINKTSGLVDDVQAPTLGGGGNAPMSAGGGEQQRPLYNSTNHNGGPTSHKLQSNLVKSEPPQSRTANPYNATSSLHRNNHSNDNDPTNDNSPMMISPVRSVADHSSSRNSNPYGHNASSASGSNHNITSNAPIVRSVAMANSSNITPINALNMYNNRWTIQGRVTNKTEIRTWSNSRGEGSLFSIDILDSSSHDIRATFFKEAVDKFFNYLKTGSVYTFTGGRLKVANMQFNTCKSSYEITFDQNAEIHEQPDSESIQRQTYDFINKICDIEMVEANKTVDVLAIVKSVGDVVKLMSKKTGQELIKCDLVLIDDSNTEIIYTLWGSLAEKAPTEYTGHPVVAIRRARVSDYNGKSIGAGIGSAIEVNPVHLSQAQDLAIWWENIGSIGGGVNGATRTKSLSTTSGGMSGKMESLLDRKDIASIKSESLGLKPDNKADWLTFKGTCVFVKRDKDGGAWYPACPNENDPCKNLFKVTQATDGRWFCDKCGNSYDNPVRRWIFSAKIEDPTGSTWVSFFNEQAQMLLDGMTADMAYKSVYDDDMVFNTDAYDSIFANALGKEAIFKCKVKNEIDKEGESRLKVSVHSFSYPIDYLQESIDMLNALQPTTS